MSGKEGEISESIILELCLKVKEICLWKDNETWTRIGLLEMGKKIHYDCSKMSMVGSLNRQQGKLAPDW